MDVFKREKKCERDIEGGGDERERERKRKRKKEGRKNCKKENSKKLLSRED